jgi:hypothetical protein
VFDTGVFPRPADLRGRRLLTGGVFVDVDNDGRTEVVFVHREPRAEHLDLPLVWALVGDTLAPHQGWQLPRGIFPTVLTDLDGDGRLDVLGMRPGPLRPGQSAAEVAGPIAVLYGAANEDFEEVRAIREPSASDPSFQMESAALADLDADGWLDLLVADNGCCARCRALHPLLRTGTRSYHDRTELLRGDLRGGAYTALAAPLFGDTQVLGAIGRLCGDSQHAFFRAVRSEPDGDWHYEGFDPTPHDALFRRENLGLSCPTIGCRAPMAAAWGDFDGDQRFDVVIPFDPLHGFFRGTAAPPWHDLSHRMPFRLTMGPRRPMLAWGTLVVDFDRDGHDDLIMAHGDDDSSAYDPSRAIGPQRVTAWRSTPTLHFTDWTAATRLSRPGQWRSIAAGDLDDDGDPDLIVGGFGEAPRVYRNEVANGQRQLSLRLRGTISNPLGLGARVETWLAREGPPVVRLVGNYATPVHAVEPVVFVGLGTLDRAPRIRVTWPSGIVQELTDLPADRAHVLTEPLGFAIDPPTRHAPADGRSQVVLRVTPPAGARVTAHLRGPGALSLSQEGEHHVVRVTAPPTPGQATITLAVDGTPLRVRPRLWWDAL